MIDISRLVVFGDSLSDNGNLFKLRFTSASVLEWSFFQRPDLRRATRPMAGRAA
jgi:phospholipase/lecithinase/hemolysin